MEGDRLSQHFVTCPKCGLPIEDDKYVFSVWVCDGVCTTVAIHKQHEGD